MISKHLADKAQVVRPGRPARWMGIVLLSFIFIASTHQLQAEEGTAGAEFLRIFPGARSAALAGCYSALGNDAETLFYNPAGILRLLNPQLGASHLVWWEGVSYDALWGVQPLGELGNLGLAVSWLNVPSFNSTDNPDIAAEQAWYSMASGSYALEPLNALYLGGQVKYILARLSTEQAWGLAMDFGAQYYSFNDQLTFAATIQNVGFLNSFIATDDSLPMQVRVGAAYQFWPDDPERLSLATEVTLPLPFSESIFIAAGFEGWLMNILALRCGIQMPADAGHWLTLGCGVQWQGWHMDYAITPLGLLGMTHRFTLSYDVGSQRRLARPRLEVTMLTKQFTHADGEAGYEIQLIPKAEVAAGLSQWSVVIRDRSQKEIKQYQGEKQLPLQVVWKGEDSMGQRVDVEGYYTYSFKIIDQLGYTAQTDGEILPISITQLPRLKVLPRDIFAGKVSFVPRSTDSIKEWTVTIMTPNGKVIKKYQGRGFIPKDFAWDGTNAQNQPVAIQKGFKFLLKTTDTTGNEMKSVSPIVVVDAGTKAYTPTGVPLREQIVFHFVVASESNIKGWALDIIETESGKVIKSCEATGPLPEKIFWDGCDEQGHLVPSNRKYSYVLRLQDAVGNIWQQAAMIKSTPVNLLAETPSELKVKIEQILFDFNQAELKPEMFEKLRTTANLVKVHGSHAVKIYIEGHTDDVGSDEYNFELSQKRAKMVMRYLIEEEKLPSSIIEIKGYGKTQPIMRGDSQEIRSLNRRVEVTLILPR